MSTNTPVWSSALQAAPGYGARASAPRPVAPPLNFSMPSLPKPTPLEGEARAPGYTARQVIGNNISGLSAQYMPQIKAANQWLRGALRGYGGWRFRSEDNLDAPEFDPNAGMGVRERQAVIGAKSRAAASGMLYSTAAEQNIGLAVQQVSEEARAQVMQYATTVGNILEGWRSTATSYVNQWAQLYGEDARWLADNPISPPPLPEGPAAPPAPTPPPAPAAPAVPLGALPSDARPAQAGWQQASPETITALSQLPTAGGLPRVGVYDNYPNLAALRARYPGVELDVRRAGNGKYVVVAIGRQTNIGGM